MQYPDNFETPAFPAGSRIASSRAAAIGISLVFMMTLFVCAMLVWASASSRVQPFLVATNENPNEWRLVGHNGWRRPIAATRVLQESLIVKFIERRFYISADAKENEYFWTPCDLSTDCATEGQTSNGSGCALFCAGGAEVFDIFLTDIVPDYRRRAAMGERWAVARETVRLFPVGTVGDAGGTWRARFTVQSNMDAPMEVIAYIKVARNINVYPRTMGFYIAAFNAYRTN